MTSSRFIFNLTNFCVIVSLLTKLLTLGILFLTAVRAAAVAKLVILGVLPLPPFILALREALVAKLAISDLSIIHIFSATSIFLPSLSLRKSTGTGTNFSTSNLAVLLFKLFKPVGKLFNLPISYLSTSKFKLGKSFFSQNLMYQQLLYFSFLVLLHNMISLIHK